MWTLPWRALRNLCSPNVTTNKTKVYNQFVLAMILLQVFLIIPRYCFHFLYLLASSAVFHIEKFNSLADSISCKKDIVDKKKIEKYALIPFINMMLKTLNRNKYTWGWGTFRLLRWRFCFILSVLTSYLPLNFKSFLSVFFFFPVFLFSGAKKFFILVVDIHCEQTSIANTAALTIFNYATQKFTHTCN